ncbi:flagellar hook assembly protein FlgD [Azospira restricta]|uniref:Basal-body rod modification protein FlgD n=1 Tax=Azospira restricta TaxID=404405 RepID=A0A974SS54_9RHOO|nr:flagellar hook assembly protein FlgD [Azospira restricta]QRJ65452.1 flagellar hook assembly protein FlgD [Azospira restricta]
MATVNSTTNSGSDVFAALGASTKKSGGSQADQIQDRFLTLLVTQLKNQDPLNPMDNAQMTSQLAQINTISGIEKLNTTLSQMLGVYNEGQAMQAAGMVGKYVLVAGNSLPLAGGQAIGGATLAGPADQVTISIYDSAGNLVQSQKLGAAEAGNLNFTWDGKKSDGSKAADGTYTFKVAAVRGNDKVEASALQLGMVNAVVRSKDGFLLDLGPQGTMAFKDVQQIL